MSDRFYNQMLEATGWCPGFKNTRTLEEYENKYGKTTRRRKMAWTDEAKAQAVEMYTAEEATPDVETVNLKCNCAPRGICWHRA